MKTTLRIFGSLAVAGLIAVVSGCGNGSISSSTDEFAEEELLVVTRKIAAFKQECGWLFGFQLCYQGRADDSQEWLPTTLPGLDFKWGHEYSVQYRDVPFENPPADAPAFTRELLVVTDLGPVSTGTEFEIAMRARDPLGPEDASYITNIGTDSYQAYFDAEFVCATPEICLQVEDIIDQNQKFLGKFGLRPELGLPLVLNQIVCVEENDDRILLCDRTLNLEVSSEILDQFMQPADTFSASEQVYASFTLNNAGSTAIDFGGTLCDQILIGFQFLNGEDLTGGNSDVACEVQGGSDVSLNANSETVLLVDLTALIVDRFGANFPTDYLVSLKFYNQPTSVKVISIQ